MVQFMTFMASLNQCMTQLMAKFNFHPNYCVFRAGFYLFCSLRAVLQLLVGEPAIVNTLALAS